MESPATAPAASAARIGSRFRRGVELVVIFGGLPLAFAIGLLPVHPLLILAPLAGWSLVALLRDPRFDRRLLWNGAALRAELPRILLVFLFGAVLMTAGVALFLPDHLFELVRSHRLIWAAVLIGYPLASVYPQELVYRAFFFHRYRPLFGDGPAMVVASGLAFAWLHVIFRNWVAVLLCLAGGLLFAARYRRAHSLAAVSLEHSLYGQWIFTAGLGQFFSEGSLAAVESVLRNLGKP